MAIYHKRDGEWKEIQFPYYKKDGDWIVPKLGYVYTEGEWRLFYRGKSITSSGIEFKSLDPELVKQDGIGVGASVEFDVEFDGFDGNDALVYLDKSAAPSVTSPRTFATSRTSKRFATATKAGLIEIHDDSYPGIGYNAILSERLEDRTFVVDVAMAGPSVFVVAAETNALDNVSLFKFISGSDAMNGSAYEIVDSSNDGGVSGAVDYIALANPDLSTSRVFGVSSSGTISPINGGNDSYSISEDPTDSETELAIDSAGGFTQGVWLSGSGYIWVVSGSGFEGLGGGGYSESVTQGNLQAGLSDEPGGNRLVGVVDGQLSVYGSTDLQNLIATIPAPATSGGLVWASSGDIFFAAEDGNVYVYNDELVLLRTLEVGERFEDAEELPENGLIAAHSSTAIIMIQTVVGGIVEWGKNTTCNTTFAGATGTPSDGTVGYKARILDLKPGIDGSGSQGIQINRNTLPYKVNAISKSIDGLGDETGEATLGTSTSAPDNRVAAEIEGDVNTSESIISANTADLFVEFNKFAGFVEVLDVEVRVWQQSGSFDQTLEADRMLNRPADENSSISKTFSVSGLEDSTTYEYEIRAFHPNPGELKPEFEGQDRELVYKNRGNFETVGLIVELDSVSPDADNPETLTASGSVTIESDDFLAKPAPYIDSIKFVAEEVGGNSSSNATVYLEVGLGTISSGVNNFDNTVITSLETGTTYNVRLVVTLGDGTTFENGPEQGTTPGQGSSLGSFRVNTSGEAYQIDRASVSGVVSWNGIPDPHLRIVASSVPRYSGEPTEELVVWEADSSSSSISPTVSGFNVSSIIDEVSVRGFWSTNGSVGVNGSPSAGSVNDSIAGEYLDWFEGFWTGDDNIPFSNNTTNYQIADEGIWQTGASNSSSNPETFNRNFKLRLELWQGPYDPNGEPFDSKEESTSFGSSEVNNANIRDVIDFGFGNQGLVVDEFTANLRLGVLFDIVTDPGYNSDYGICLTLISAGNNSTPGNIDLDVGLQYPPDAGGISITFDGVPIFSTAHDSNGDPLINTPKIESRSPLMEATGLANESIFNLEIDPYEEYAAIIVLYNKSNGKYAPVSYSTSQAPAGDPQNDPF